MLCKKPYLIGCLPFGCGQCLPCRINRRRLWTHRMILESFVHSASSFVTLTYAPEHMPENATLVPKHTQEWLKRLRKAVYPRRLRYFLVGEYGDETQRPHYHLALYGLGILDRDVIHDTWGKGHVMVGELTPASAQYVAGYVTKKMTKKEDIRLKGRYPEFARMSLRPGLGASAMLEVGKAVSASSVPVGLIVPSVLQHGRKKMPLGRYLRRKLRERLNINEEAAKNAAVSEYAVQMREVFKDAFKNEENASLSLTAILVRRNQQEFLNTETRYNIFRKKGSL